MLHEALYSAIVCLAVFLGYRFARYRLSSELFLAQQVKPLLNRLKRISGASEPAEICGHEIQGLDAFLQQLAFQHDLLKDVVQTISEGILILQNGAILFVNQAVMKMLNIPGGLEQWHGRPFLEFCRHLTVQNGLAAWQNYKEKQVVVLELQTAVLEVEICGIANDSLVLLLWRDITPISNAEAHGRELVANVAHQLRTPITVIRGYAETLLDNESCDAAALKRFLEVILRNSKRLSRFIEDILTIAMLDSKGLTQKEEMSLDELLKSVLEMAGEEARAKGVRIQVQNELKHDLLLSASSLLEQAVFNVLHNAVKYTKPDSMVRVVVTAFNERVILRISDQGPGIPKEMQRLVFERFFRMSDGPASQIPGSGLGLAIAKEVIVAHGGSIYVESEGNGRGSTFVMELPLSMSE
ncbi:MAG: PAS domain-containing sensor histidine kinase [Deltaproteobacteria bacterium]|nr:PAS domain-containing sensor histidine kinase [Deltaproteobacteria bacterium]